MKFPSNALIAALTLTAASSAILARQIGPIDPEPRLRSAINTPGADPADRTECLIRPSEVVRLSTPVEGVVAAVLVERGASVRKGQIVARMDNRVQEQAVALAAARAHDASTIERLRAASAFADRRLARTERLLSRGFIPRATADQIRTEAEMANQALAEAQLANDMARIELEQAKAVVAQRVLRSPVTGVIVERSMSAGEFRGEQSHIFTIAQIDPLNVEAYLPVDRLKAIRLGQTMQVHPEPPFDQGYDARVTVIDRVVDSASGTFGVRLKLPNPDRQLRAGLKCSLQLP